MTTRESMGEDQFSGPLLRDARVQAGTRQRDLALRIGCSAATVSSYERGRVVPPPDVLVRVCETLGVDPCDLHGVIEGADTTPVVRRGFPPDLVPGNTPGRRRVAVVSR